MDPASIRLADAVYASSAFPLAYPNLALGHFGQKIAYQGRLIFLADGGLADNSGLVTLLTQMRWHLTRSPRTRLVLGLEIDASLAGFRGISGTSFQMRGIEDAYAWTGTYVGHAVESINGGFEGHEGAVLSFLARTGAVRDELVLNYETKLQRVPADVDATHRASWLPELKSGQLLLRPLVISLRLRDILRAYHHVWQQYANHPEAQDPTLTNLFAINGIAEDYTNPAQTNRLLTHRLAEVKTDFVLSGEHRKLLDLVAYLLVHGSLRPALAKWTELAGARLAHPTR